MWLTVAAAPNARTQIDERAVLFEAYDRTVRPKPPRSFEAIDRMITLTFALIW
jgi:hypothetical protein